MKDAKDNLREDAEPTVRHGSVYLPMWLTGLLGLLIYWGFNFIDAHGGGYNELVYEPYRSTNQLASFLPTDEIGQQLKMGAQVYKQFCEACHQPNGGGNPAQAPPLASSEWVLASGPNRIIRIPLRGLTGPIQVKGADVNMTMFAVAANGAMTDEQLAAVMTYIRNSFGNKASAVTPEQVKKVQSAIKDHPDHFTGDELLKLPVEVQ